MQLIYKTVRGSQETVPETLDTTSSPYKVYLRKNIHRVIVPDMMAAEDENKNVLLWEYDEACLTLEEYAEYEAEMLSPGYLDLKEQQEALEDANAAIMLQQAEIQATQAEQDDVLAEILLNTMMEV